MELGSLKGAVDMGLTFTLFTLVAKMALTK